MEELLARLIYNNVKNNKEIDENFIRLIVDLVIDEWKIQDYQGDVSVKNKSNTNELASYDFYYKRIILNEELLAKKFFNFSYGLGVKTPLNKYLAIIYIVLHELVHAKQYDIKKAFYDEAEKLIVYSEIEHEIEAINNNKIKSSKFRKYLKLLSDYYLFSPIEKIAEVDSVIVVGRISSLLNDNYMYEVLKLMAFYNLVRGYRYENKLLYPPTPMYLNIIGETKYIDRINELSLTCSDLEKLRLGLNCNLNTYFNVCDNYSRQMEKVKELIKKI